MFFPRTFCPHNVLSPRMFCLPDVLSLRTFVRRTFCRYRRFVPTEALSPQMFCPHGGFVHRRFVSGRFVWAPAKVPERAIMKQLVISKATLMRILSICPGQSYWSHHYAEQMEWIFQHVVWCPRMAGNDQKGWVDYTQLHKVSVYITKYVAEKNFLSQKLCFKYNFSSQVLVFTTLIVAAVM